MKPSLRAGVSSARRIVVDRDRTIGFMGEAARVADILMAISEAASLAPVDRRPAEALALLEHLLGLYGLSAPRYLSILALREAPVQAALSRVRLLCRPFG